MSAGVARLVEVAGIFYAHGRLTCTPTVKEEDGQISVTVTLHAADVGDALDGLELLAELKYLSDVAQVRRFATDYGIDPAALETLIASGRLHD